MTRPPLLPSEADATRGIVVDGPRACDAIGGALRSAFSRDAGLPPEMQMLVQRIDRAAGF